MHNFSFVISWAILFLRHFFFFFCFHVFVLPWRRYFIIQFCLISLCSSDYFANHMGDYEGVLASLETLNLAILKAMDFTKKVSNVPKTDSSVSLLQCISPSTFLSIYIQIFENKQIFIKALLV